MDMQDNAFLNIPETTEEKLDRETKEQAYLYLDGISLREIAKRYKVSHVTVHYNLSYRLGKIDKTLYEKVGEKLESNRSSKLSIKESDVVERILNAYRLLVFEDKSVEEISKILKTPYLVIYRDLTIRLRNINAIAPEIVTESMCTLVEEIFRKHVTDNLINVNKANCKN